MPHVLEVLLHGQVVGTVTNLPDDYNVFAFGRNYLDDEQRPTLSLGFRSVSGGVVVPDRTPRVRVPAFFSNLLPEGHLREYLARRGRVNPARDFPLLWLLGADLPGAVTVRHIDGVPLVAGDEDELTPKEIDKSTDVLRFSLAGVQLKFSAVMEARGGLTIPARGMNGEWILKLPSPTYPHVPENEFAMLTFAREVGIEVPESGLVDLSNVHSLPTEIRSDLGRALYVKRFDRDGARRIHIEDFNQVYRQFPPDKYKNVSYGGMLGVIWRVMGEAAARDFIGRLIFSVGIGNADMHLKNWSVIYRDGRTPELAPAYDYLSTIPYIPDDKLALTIAGTREWSEVSDDLLERFARKAGVPRGVVIEPARDMAVRMQEVWPKLKPDLDLPRRIVDVVDAHMKRIPQLAQPQIYTIGAADDRPRPRTPKRSGPRL